MNSQLTQMLQNILEALMTISTRGNDTITMSNCLQALQNVIETERAAAAQAAASTPSAESVKQETVE